jgi:hypothetical protein
MSYAASPPPLQHPIPRAPFHPPEPPRTPSNASPATTDPASSSPYGHLQQQPSYERYSSPPPNIGQGIGGGGASFGVQQQSQQSYAGMQGVCYIPALASRARAAGRLRLTTLPRNLLSAAPNLDAPPRFVAHLHVIAYQAAATTPLPSHRITTSRSAPWRPPRRRPQLTRSSSSSSSSSAAGIRWRRPWARRA